MAQPAPPGVRHASDSLAPLRQDAERTRESIAVILACTHRILSAGLARLLSAEPDMRVLAEVADARAAIRVAAADPCHVVLMEFPLLAAELLPVLRALRALPRRPRLILLATPADRAGVLEALRLGAWGLVSADAPPEQLVHCVRVASKGEAWVDRDTVSHLLESIHDRSGAAAMETRAARVLTPREIDIVAEVALGASNNDIGRTLGLRSQTVKNRLSAIFDKVGVSSRLELALYAVHHDIAAMKAEQRLHRSARGSPALRKE